MLGVFRPLVGVGPVGDVGDTLFGGGIGGGGEPEFAGVVAGEEEPVLAVGGRDYPAAGVLAETVEFGNGLRGGEDGKPERARRGGSAGGEDVFEGPHPRVGGEVFPAGDGEVAAGIGAV